MARSVMSSRSQTLQTIFWPKAFEQAHGREQVVEVDSTGDHGERPMTPLDTCINHATSPSWPPSLDVGSKLSSDFSQRVDNYLLFGVSGWGLIWCTYHQTTCVILWISHGFNFVASSGWKYSLMYSTGVLISKEHSIGHSILMDFDLGAETSILHSLILYSSKIACLARIYVIGD